MTAIFGDLMNGLDEVNAFLGGKTAGYKINESTKADAKSTASAAAIPKHTSEERKS